MPWPAIGAAVAGGMSLIGGERGNRAARKESARDRTFSAGEADKSRRFSERMRNTEWQAGVADMTAAGLNPALAYSQGGASSPGGAMASGSMAGQEDTISPAVSSAMQYKRLEEELNNLRATRGKIEAETEVIKARPGRVATPVINRAAAAVEDMFSDRSMGIMNYEAGSSAKQILENGKNLINRLQNLWRNRGTVRGSIGPEIRRRIR